MSSNEDIVVYRRQPRTREQIAEMTARGQPPDGEIDFADHPEASTEAMAQAERGTMYRALKRQTTLRIDADVLDWFKRHASNGKGYQTDINRVLRDYVAEQAKKKAG